LQIVDDAGTSDTEQEVAVAPKPGLQPGRPLARPRRAVRPSQKASEAAEIQKLVPDKVAGSSGSELSDVDETKEPKLFA